MAIHPPKSQKTQSESFQAWKMAGVSQFFFYLYALTLIFFACVLEDLANRASSAVKFIVTSVSRPIATARFLKLLDEENPAARYKIGTLVEPKKCAVCLSRLVKGERVRNLKCNHMFHKVCVDTWLQQDLAIACPLCRRTVLPEEIMMKLRQRINGDLAFESSDEEIIFLLSSLQDSNSFSVLN